MLRTALIGLCVTVVLMPVLVLIVQLMLGGLDNRPTHDGDESGESR